MVFLESHRILGVATDSQGYYRARVSNLVHKGLVWLLVLFQTVDLVLPPYVPDIESVFTMTLIRIYCLLTINEP